MESGSRDDYRCFENARDNELQFQFIFTSNSEQVSRV